MLIVFYTGLFKAHYIKYINYHGQLSDYVISRIGVGLGVSNHREHRGCSESHRVFRVRIFLLHLLWLLHSPDLPTFPLLHFHTNTTLHLSPFLKIRFLPIVTIVTIATIATPDTLRYSRLVGIRLWHFDSLHSQNASLTNLAFFLIPPSLSYHLQ